MVRGAESTALGPGGEAVFNSTALTHPGCDSRCGHIFGNATGAKVAAYYKKVRSLFSPLPLRFLSR